MGDKKSDLLLMICCNLLEVRRQNSGVRMKVPATRFWGFGGMAGTSPACTGGLFTGDSGF
jgi:hypothetical protein